MNLDKSEKKLIQDCIDYKRKAQSIFYKKYYGMLMSICLRYVNNREDALDILNQSYLKIFAELKNFDPNKGQLKSWMYRITMNKSIDHYRKQAKRRTINHELKDQYCDLPTDYDPISDLTAKELLALIHELSPAYRIVFNLYVIESMNHKEIAKELGISEGSSKSNLFKARKNLRVLWAEKNYISSNE